MKKNVKLIINEKEYNLGKYNVKEVSDLYLILFENRDKLIENKIEWVEEYVEESYFSNDINNFLDFAKNKEFEKNNILWLSFNLNDNIRIEIISE